MVDTQPPDRPDPPRTRLESELLEILERTDRPPSNVIKFRRDIATRRHSWRDRVQNRISHLDFDHGLWLVVSFVLGLLAYVLEPSSTLIARLLAWASIAAFIALFVKAFGRPTEPSTQRWRGQDIDFRGGANPFSRPRKPRQ